jgi:hypothetical protein
MSLHYRDASNEALHDYEILGVMGDLTAKMIALSQEHEQHEILKELNRIASRYLSKPGRLSAQRPEYVQDVNGIIKRFLRVGSSAVFYKSRFEAVIECIGSTGTWDVREKRAITLDEIASVRYDHDNKDRRTVKCFLDNKTQVTKDATEDEDVLFTERDLSKPRPTFDPSVYVPIPDPLAPADSPKSIGVIRCYGHQSYVFGGEYANFDHIDLNTLKFIADQIAPILKIFHFRMAREQAVIATKHDLYAPLRMARDAIEEVIADSKSGRAIRFVELEGLRTTLAFMRNMIGVLDPDPEKVPQAMKRPTLLEGDIIARLKDMLTPWAKEYEMAIRFDGFRQIPSLWLDRELMERAMFNLIVNAIKYGKRMTEIRVDAAVRDDPPQYEIDVINEGPGVPDGIPEEHLFLPGYRTPQVRHIAMGQGLGLTIARAAIRAHGAGVGADVVLARRRNPTIFRVVLPVEGVSG